MKHDHSVHSSSPFERQGEHFEVVSAFRNLYLHRQTIFPPCSCIQLLHEALGIFPEDIHFLTEICWVGSRQQAYTRTELPPSGGKRKRGIIVRQRTRWEITRQGASAAPLWERGRCERLASPGTGAKLLPCDDLTPIGPGSEQVLSNACPRKEEEYVLSFTILHPLRHAYSFLPRSKEGIFYFGTKPKLIVYEHIYLLLICTSSLCCLCPGR